MKDPQTNQVQDQAGPVSLLTAAFHGASRAEFQILDTVYPPVSADLKSQPCWLHAIRGEDGWTLTRYTGLLDRDGRFQGQADAQVVKAEKRISRGEMIRAMSAWVQAQSGTKTETLPQRMFGDAVMVSGSARKSYKRKPGTGFAG